MMLHDELSGVKITLRANVPSARASQSTQTPKCESKSKPEHSHNAHHTAPHGSAKRGHGRRDSFTFINPTDFIMKLKDGFTR